MCSPTILFKMSAIKHIIVLLIVYHIVPLNYAHEPQDGSSMNDVWRIFKWMQSPKEQNIEVAPPAKLWKRNQIAEINLDLRSPRKNIQGEGIEGIPQSGLYHPGDAAPSFTLPTLDGILTYPGDVITSTTPIILHTYSPRSAFLKCLWNCTGSIESLIKYKPLDTHLIFFSQEDTAYTDAKWMKNRFKSALDRSAYKNSVRSSSILSYLHFVTVPLDQVGNWIPAVFKQWMCSGHNCGLDQAVFHTKSGRPIITPRLDARYDWLPSFKMNTAYNVSRLITGCSKTSSIKGRVALVTDTGCSFFEKILMSEKSGAVGVVVVPVASTLPRDMNCNGTECSTPINIPATMIDPAFADKGKGLVDALNVTFQNTPYENFFFSIDRQGSLQEVGWQLYPSFQFLVWHAQWLDYTSQLQNELNKEAFTIPVMKGLRMQGNRGAISTIDLPSMEHMASFAKVELDMALSCPGKFDATCPHWDHTVQLFICCNQSSPLCGAELGRWISPFRRRIGRWLTDVTPLLPLMDGPRCTFTMKTVPWAMPWSPSLILRFSGTRTSGTYI